MASTPAAQKPWKVEYAKSSRASCRSCSSPIAKDAFRLAKMLQSTQFDGYMAVMLLSFQASVVLHCSAGFPDVALQMP